MLIRYSQTLIHIIGLLATLGDPETLAMTTLSLNYSGIESLPEGLEKLTHVESLPSSMTKLTKLKYLNLYRTPITSKKIDTLAGGLPRCRIVLHTTQMDYI